MSRVIWANQLIAISSGLKRIIVMKFGCFNLDIKGHFLVIWIILRLYEGKHFKVMWSWSLPSDKGLKYSLEQNHETGLPTRTNVCLNKLEQETKPFLWLRFVKKLPGQTFWFMQQDRRHFKDGKRIFRLLIISKWHTQTTRETVDFQCYQNHNLCS